MSRVDYIQKFLAVAASNPTQIAVCEIGQEFTYQYLAEKIKVLASLIAEKSNQPKVLIHLPAGVNAYASMFAAGLAGGYYSPVNVNQPTFKRLSTLRKFDPDVIVCDQAGLDEMGFAREKVILVEELAETYRLVDRPRSTIAYVIFTSGSTGDPKGVVIGQAALSHYVDWIEDAYRPSISDRWSQHPNIAFDLSVLDIYGALCHGASLYPMNNELERMVPSKAIQKNRLTIWNSVPSVLDMMIKVGGINPESWKSVRIATFCGEPLRKHHLESIFKARPDIVVYNTYGPTEATVSCTLRRIHAHEIEKVSGESVALGEAIPGMHLKLVLDGVEADQGEIVLYGSQLADGYWHDEIRTAEHFKPIEIDGVKSLAYFTGDWGRRENGELFFQTRMDGQIKIKGYRLELQEVNGALYKCGFLAAATVFYEGDLYSFVQTTDADNFSASKIRDELAQWLEPHAVPRYVVGLAELPKNDNDKIDLKALRLMIENGVVSKNG